MEQSALSLVRGRIWVSYSNQWSSDPWTLSLAVQVVLNQDIAHLKLLCPRMGNK